jgi:hypothetical protein
MNYILPIELIDGFSTGQPIYLIQLVDRFSTYEPVSLFFRKIKN